MDTQKTSGKARSQEVVYRDIDLSTGEDIPAVDALLDEVEAADGVAAYSEAFLRAVKEAGEGFGDDGDQHYRHLLAEVDDRIIGVVSVNRDNIAEIAVHPDYRRWGIGSSMLREIGRRLDGDQPLSVWSHGVLPAAQEFAGRRDARAVRELLKMSVDCSAETTEGAARRDELLSGRDTALATVRDDGFRVLNYTESVEAYGEETADAEWLRVNNEAFAWHPEQGGWDLQRLIDARDVDWFDPAGVLFLWQDGECLGFHWTKRPDGDPHGEVYVVCLADAARGRRLGTPLTLLGMGYLLDNGAEAVDLYVEGDNVPAVSTYRKLGFEIVHRDVVYRGIL